MKSRRKRKNAKPESIMLLCMREKKEVPADDPRCPYPTSRCEYRELCEIAALLRRSKRN